MVFSSNNNSGIFSTFMIGLLMLFALAPTLPLSMASTESLGVWTSTTSYPNMNGAIDCVISGGYIYCISGYGTVYYAPVSSSGVGTWMQTTKYPTSIFGETCVAYDGYIYCISGNCSGCNGLASPQPTPEAYYAPLSSSGVGTWVKTTNYPNPAMWMSCVADSGFVYCIGGEQTYGTLQSNLAYYAPISPSGIGTWSVTTSYPITIAYESCVASGGYIYCVDGQTASGPRPVNSTYYAQISPSGIGSWIQSTSYPISVDLQSCAASSGYIYCVAGYTMQGDTNAAYYSPILQSGGVGSWTSTTNYPVTDEFLSCLTSSGYIYCVAGESTNATYYTSISDPVTSQLTVASQSTNGNAITGYYTILYDGSGNVAATGFTAVAFTLNSGQIYSVQVDDYGSCSFAYWQDTGSTANPRAISISTSTQIVAVYNCDPPSGLSISSVDQNNNPISGYYTVLYDSGGDVLATGFTPATFSTNVGVAYSVQASNYGSCSFNHWSDGVVSNPRTFAASSRALSFTSVYNCGTTGSSKINVVTVNSAGDQLYGYYITLQQGGFQIASCWSQCSFSVNSGQTYQIIASSYGIETFDHWQNDGSIGMEIISVPNLDNQFTVTAVYSP